jgi:hypothetical protein
MFSYSVYVARSIRNWLLTYELHKEGSPIHQLKALPAFYGASNVILLTGQLLLPLDRYYRKLLLFNTFDPSGYYIHQQFNIQQFYVLPTQCIYVFCVDLRISSDYFPIQH